LIIESTVSALCDSGAVPRVSINADLGSGLVAYHRPTLAEVKRLAEPEPDYRQPEALTVQMVARQLHAEIKYADGEGSLEIWGQNINPGWDEPLRRAGAHARFYCGQEPTYKTEPSDRIRRITRRGRVKEWWHRVPNIQKIVVGVAIPLLVAMITWLVVTVRSAILPGN